MSKLLSNIPKHRRVLVEVKVDGSAKTFVYKDIDEKPCSNQWIRLFGRKLRKLKHSLG